MEEKIKGQLRSNSWKNEVKLGRVSDFNLIIFLRKLNFSSVDVNKFWIFDLIFLLKIIAVLSSKPHCNLHKTVSASVVMDKPECRGKVTEGGYIFTTSLRGQGVSGSRI